MQNNRTTTGFPGFAIFAVRAVHVVVFEETRTNDYSNRALCERSFEREGLAFFAELKEQEHSKGASREICVPKLIVDNQFKY